MRALLALSCLLPAVALGGYQASSFKKESKLGANYWNAAAALDGNFDTAWMVNPEQDNRGQWIELDVPVGHVDKISLVPGWDMSEDKFFDYVRIKKAKVEVFDLENDNAKVLEQVVDFEDKRGWQLAELTDTKVGGEYSGGRVRLTVLDTYDGKDYPMLAVSEILVHLKEFPVVNPTVSGEPSSEEAGHEGKFLVDGNTRTYWAASDIENPAEVTFSVGNYGVSSIGIQAGPKPYARPKTVTLDVDGNTKTVTMKDNGEMQWFLVPALVGYTGSAWGTVKVTVNETYAATAEGKGASIDEVQFRATNLEAF